MNHEQEPTNDPLTPPNSGHRQAAHGGFDADFIKRAVADAMNQPPEKRDGFIAGATRGHHALRAEVEKLVAALEHAGNFMNAVTGPAAVNPSSEITSALPSPHELVGSKIGQYKLLELIGEGGFGSVFMAEQREPVQRKVALKVIKPGMDSKLVSARFEAERQALALMDHPHIARVFDGGVTDAALGSRPYFVMEYVRGETIITFANAHKLNLKDRLALFTQVCQAVQHAHTKGIIHRDLKPGNILVSMTDGRPFAKVIDFGIAKATGSRLTDKTLFTEHRQLIGTPEYMSPEQAEGSPDIDTRTDVYALGVLLYELLTNATPFDAKRLRSAAFAEMQRIIKEEEPPKPSLKITLLSPKPSRAGFQPASSLPTKASGTGVPPVSPPPPQPSGAGFQPASTPSPSSPSPKTPLFSPRDLQGELDWIVMKALDKDRARRYESPNQLAADVQRHLSGEAVVAAPPTMGYRVRKFVKRNKGKVIAGSAVAAALLVGIAGTAWGLRQARQANVKKDKQIELATSALSSILVEQLNHSDQPEFPLIPGTPAYRLKPILKPSPDNPVGGPVTHVTINFQKEFEDGGALPVPIEGENTLPALADLSLALAKKSLAAQDELEMQADAAEWSAYTANLSLAQFEMDSGNWPAARARVAACPENKRGWEWRYLSMLAGCTLGEYRDAGGIYSASLNRDGTRLVSSAGFKARVWDTATGKLLAESGRHGDAITSISLSPDSTFFVTSSEDKTARIWSTSTGEPISASFKHPDVVKTAGFSPDGTRIVTASVDGTARVWNSASGALIAILGGHNSAVCFSAAFSPDGTRIVTASSDKTVRIWNAASGAVASTLSGHKGPVYSAAFSLDGTRIVSASDDRTVRVWDAVTGNTIVIFDAANERVVSAAFSPDGAWILTESPNGSPRVWDANTGQLLLELKGHVGNVSSAVFSSDGTRIVTAGNDSVRIWDATSDAIMMSDMLPYRLFGYTDSVGDWATSSDPDLRVAVVRGIAAPRPTAMEITTPDHSRRIIGSSDGTLRFFEATLPGRHLASFRVGGPVSGLEMTPDGTRLIIFVEGEPSVVWDIRDPEERRKDLQREWAERVPAGTYLDTLWARSTDELPTDKIRDAIVNDATLSVLRRLVAVEMLDEKRAEFDDAVREAFEAITKDQTDPGAVQAAAKAADLPARVKEAVVAQAAKWEYKKPEGEGK